MKGSVDEVKGLEDQSVLKSIFDSQNFGMTRPQLKGGLEKKALSELVVCHRSHAMTLIGRGHKREMQSTKEKE
jgi:hypothetical protein